MYKEPANKSVEAAKSDGKQITEESHRLEDREVTMVAVQEATLESRRNRAVEARRLAEKRNRARQARLALEAKLAEETRQVQIRIEQEALMENEREDEETPSEDISLNFANHGLSADASGGGERGSRRREARNGAPESKLALQMAKEAQRLSKLIWRYEKKLEVVCKSLLTIAQKDIDDENLKQVRTAPLSELYGYIAQQAWYQNYTQGDANIASSQSRMPSLVISSHVSESMPSEDVEERSSRGTLSSGREIAIDNTAGPLSSSVHSFRLTPIGDAFLKMDGPVQADVGRFLSSLKVGEQLTRSRIETNWAEIARISRDAQSMRIYNKLEALIEFCVDNKLIEG